MSELMKALQECYGALWLDQPVRARQRLADILTKEQRGQGIETARKRWAGAEKNALPPPVVAAVKALATAESLAAEYAELRGEDADLAAIKIRMVAMNLERWAEGL